MQELIDESISLANLRVRLGVDYHVFRDHIQRRMPIDIVNECWNGLADTPLVLYDL